MSDPYPSSYPYPSEDDSHADPTRPADEPRPTSETSDPTNGPTFGSSDASTGAAYGAVYGSSEGSDSTDRGDHAGAPGESSPFSAYRATYDSPTNSSPTNHPPYPGGSSPFSGSSSAYGTSASQPPYSSQTPYSSQPPYGQDPRSQPQAPYGSQGYAPTQAPDPSDRGMAMLAHLSMLLGMLLSAGWLTFVGPLVIWAIYKDKSPFVRQAAAGSFNFALTATLASIAAWAAFATVVGIVVAIPLWIAVFICSIVFPIMGAMKADKLQPYHYPMAIPVLS